MNRRLMIYNIFNISYLRVLNLLYLNRGRLVESENMSVNAEHEMSPGVVHKVPEDLRKSVCSSPEVLARWQALTPLARNEWLCWIEDAKKTETRIKRINRVNTDLIDGKKRPCCWPGCPHR